MKLALFLFLAIGWAYSAKAEKLPDCREIWRAGEHKFDFREPYAEFQDRLKRPSCQKEWTILVYMAADNDLYPYALWDLYEMEAAFRGSDNAGSGIKTDLLVQADGPDRADLRRLHIFSGPVAYSPRRREDFLRSNLDQVRSPIVEKLEENKRESEQVRLENFLLWGAANYPAKNYMVIVWGHGQGWKAYPVQKAAESRFLTPSELPAAFPSVKPDPTFGGIAFRQSTGTWLDIPALKNALTKFRQETGKAIDVYASDSCLMQMVEVAYELSSEARFVVGSTQLQNFLGLPYRRILYELNTGSFNGMRKSVRSGVDSRDEPLLLAKMIPGLMKQSLDPRRGLQGRAEQEAQKFITSSSLTSGEMNKLLVPALGRLSQSLKIYLQEDRFRVLDIRFVMQNVPNFEGGAQDLGIFLGYLELLLKNEKNKNGVQLSRGGIRLQESVLATKAALDRSVLAYAYGGAYGIDEQSQLVGFIPRAVSLWLPVDPKEYAARRGEFARSRLYQDTGWQAWLDVVFPR